MTNKLKIEYVPITEIKPNEYNPKQMTEKEAEDLEKSIIEFGIVDPLIVNNAEKRKGIIIGGHQRYKIYQKLKYKEVPVVWVEIPDLKKERELCLRLSKNTGSWDLDLLANFDENLLKDVGWENEELDEIFNLDMGEDEFDVEQEYEKIKEPKVKFGELYQLGEHRLLCGDATKQNDIDKLMGGEKANMVFTDPPYGLGGYAGRSGKFSPVIGDEGNILRFYQIIPITKEMYIFGDWKFFTQIINILGMPKSIIIWKKPTFGMGRGYRRQYELLFYWGNYKGTKYGDVWEFERENKYQHPTQKPLELVGRAIRNSSKRDEIILDLFGGSGSTLISAEKEGRKCYMMEIDGKYCDIIISRWEKFTNKKAKKLEI